MWGFLYCPLTSFFQSQQSQGCCPPEALGGPTDLSPIPCWSQPRDRSPVFIPPVEGSSHQLLSLGVQTYSESWHDQGPQGPPASPALFPRSRGCFLVLRVGGAWTRV